MSSTKTLFANAYQNWRRKQVDTTVSLFLTRTLITNSIQTKYTVHHKFLSTSANDASTTPDLKSFFEQLGKKLNVRKWEDWYRTRPNDITEFSGGDKILSTYSSYIHAIKAAFPDFPWKTWRFIQVIRLTFLIFRFHHNTGKTNQLIENSLNGLLSSTILRNGKTGITLRK